MDRLSSDIPSDDTEKKAKAEAPVSSRRKFLRAAAASSGVALLSAELVPSLSHAGTDRVAQLVLLKVTPGIQHSSPPGFGSGGVDLGAEV